MMLIDVQSKKERQQVLTALQNEPIRAKSVKIEKYESYTPEPTIGSVLTGEPVLAVPDIVGQVIANPLSIVGEIGNILFGTRAEKVETASKFVPAGMTQDTGEVSSFSAGVKKVIETQKEVAEGATEFWSTPVLGATNIVLPEITIPDIVIPEIPNPFADIGDWLNTAKWILIGGGVLVGIYFVSKLFGGKK